MITNGVEIKAILIGLTGFAERVSPDFHISQVIDNQRCDCTPETGSIPVRATIDHQWFAKQRSRVCRLRPYQKIPMESASGPIATPELIASLS